MSIPTLDALRLEIVMHRDVHFGSSFDIMLDYYRKGGVGVMPDFDIETIVELSNVENVEKALPEPALSEIEKAKKRYQDLREVYNQEAPIPKLLSDLILSEEEDPVSEIEAIVAYGNEIVDPLLDMIHADTFYNPLYPGYGRTPIFAARCLSKIGDERAIAPLFEAIGHENFFTDDAIIAALASFGEPAKKFLLDIVTKKPFSKDNDHAAIALCSFEPDEKIAKTALTLLEDDGHARPSLAPYLVFMCEGLPKEEHERFKEVAKKLPEPLNASMILQS